MLLPHGIDMEAPFLCLNLCLLYLKPCRNKELTRLKIWDGGIINEVVCTHTQSNREA